VSLLLGVDGGGTKTDVLLATRDGRVVARARSGPSNHEAVGLDGALAALSQGVTACLSAAGAAEGDVVASGWGLSGVDFPPDTLAYGELVDRLGLGGPRVVLNDAYVALRAGSPSGIGIAVNSGTGVIAAGRNPGGAVFRTLGVGAGFGDWGSGGDIVRAAVHAVAQEFTGLGPPTALTAGFLARTGAPTPSEFLERWWRRREVVVLTPADVWEVAEGGDAVAADIAERVAGSLTAAAAAVARRLSMDRPDHDPYPVVLAGGVLSPGHPVLRTRLASALVAELPAGRPARLAATPAAGAVMEAARLLGDLADTFCARLLAGAPVARDP